MVQSPPTSSNNFYGVPLNDDMWNAPDWQLKSLCIISLLIIFQPKAFRKTIKRSIVFWIIIIGAAVATPLATFIPILSTIVGTRSTYPYLIVILHSFIAAATYRSKHGDGVHYLQSLLPAFFLYGFGGSIVSDLFMGLPVTALSHARIIPCYLIGWSLVWLFPYDFMFKSYIDSSSSLHYFFQACEAIDSVTTPMGRISRSARELPNNKTTAPIVAGLMAGFGGACIRFAVGESTSIDALESGFWKTISYSFLWWWLAVRNCQDEDYVFFSGEITDDKDRSIFQNMNKCESYSGSDQVRVVFVLAHTIWIILTTIGVVSGHPLVWLCKKVLLGRVMTFPAYFFHLGPGDNDNKDDNDDSDSDDHKSYEKPIQSKKED